MASVSGEAVTGAATGAAAGSSFGPWGIAIGAATGLLGGLLSSSARREEEKRRKKFEAEQLAFQTQANAAKTQTEGENNAFHQMMSGYQSSLLRGG